MKAKKIIFSLITFGVFIYLFLNFFQQEKKGIFCAEKGIIKNFNLPQAASDIFCNEIVKESNQKIIRIASTTVNIEIASSSEEMMIGLSDRVGLKDGEGMLFVFNNMGNHGFWMKGMNFPIDIIFMDENFVVSGIENSLATSTYPEIFGGNFVSKYVLEVTAGFANKNQIKIGDKADLIN